MRDVPPPAGPGPLHENRRDKAPGRPDPEERGGYGGRKPTTVIMRPTSPGASHNPSGPTSESEKGGAAEPDRHGSQ